MNAPERRSVSLAGLRLIGAGAVLGLALAVPSPASGSSSDTARRSPSDSAQVVEPDRPDR